VSVRPPAAVAGALAACALAAGCGSGSTKLAPPVDRAAVAKRFAQAIFRGDTTTALALLESRQGLSDSVRRAAAPWKLHHGSLRLPASGSGSRFVFGFSGTHPHPDGRFELIRGDLVVVVGPAAVQAFTFRNLVMQFKTHHDSQLLPSDR
jgi:hypothetical protein